MIYILRGLPGSGKSTFAKSVEDAEIFSADAWHMIDGKYAFDPRRAGYAHNECFKCYLSAIMVEKRCQNFIVDNTNTTPVELAPYVRVAEAFGKEYVIVHFDIDLWSSRRRNIHGVPDATLLRMQANLNEPLPPHWKVSISFGG